MKRRVKPRTLSEHFSTHTLKSINRTVDKAPSNKTINRLKRGGGGGHTVVSVSSWFALSFSPLLTGSIVCSFYLVFSLHLLSHIAYSPAQFAHFLVPLRVFILLTSSSSESVAVCGWSQHAALCRPDRELLLMTLYFVFLHSAFTLD